LTTSSPSTPWETKGNSNIISTDYIGTINNSDFTIKTNTGASGGERMRFTSDGHIIISNYNLVSDDLLSITGNTKINGNVDIAGILKLSTFNLSAPALVQVGVNGELSHSPIPTPASLNYWNKPSASNEINYLGKVTVNESPLLSGETFHVIGRSLFDGNVNLNGTIKVPSFINTTDELVKVDANKDLSSISYNDVNYWKKTASSIIQGNVDINYTAGSVGIGLDPHLVATNPKYKLLVEGTIGAREIIVKAPNTNWPDYVFTADYKLLQFAQLEKYIANNKHLPDMPSASEIEANGQSLSEIQRLQQQKIEELYLYVLQQQKEIEALKKLLNK
jgi:hypothetical protein